MWIFRGDRRRGRLRYARKLQEQFKRAGAAAPAPAPGGWTPSSDLLDVLADQRKSIHAWLRRNAKGLHVSNVEENPHSRPGQPLYNRFVTAWERVADQTVKLVFHGTAEANIPSILRDGLDPKRRAGQAHGPGEYFAGEGHSSISVAYCKGGTRRYPIHGAFKIHVPEPPVEILSGPA